MVSRAWFAPLVVPKLHTPPAVQDLAGPLSSPPAAAAPSSAAFSAARLLETPASEPPSPMIVSVLATPYAWGRAGESMQTTRAGSSPKTS